MFAATASGIYKNVGDAQDAMSCGFDCEYIPDKNNAEEYERLYKEYSIFGDFIESQTGLFKEDD